MEKLLAKKCSGKLYEVTERLKITGYEKDVVLPMCEEILMAAKAPKKNGNGYTYPVSGHVTTLDGAMNG